MPRFAVYEYDDQYDTVYRNQYTAKSRTGGCTKRKAGGRRLCFEPQPPKQRRGKIVAPEGVRQVADLFLPFALLFVPGSPDPALTAREAVALAQQGKYGLQWEPAESEVAS